MGPYALKPGEGWTYNDGIDFTVKAGELRSTNGATFIEYLTRKGEEPPDHTHPSEDEMFYVLEGELDLMAFEPTERTGERWWDWESSNGERVVRASAGSQGLWKPT